MADGINKVFISGNLVADPELRVTQSGSGVLNFRIATNESYLDKQNVRQEKTEYSNIMMCGKRGESLSKLLSKGQMVFVEGSLRTSSYDKGGEKRYKTEIVASNIVLTGARDASGRSPQQPSLPVTSAKSINAEFDEMGDIPF